MGSLKSIFKKKKVEIVGEELEKYRATELQKLVEKKLRALSISIIVENQKHGKSTVFIRSEELVIGDKYVAAISICTNINDLQVFKTFMKLVKDDKPYRAFFNDRNEIVIKQF